MKARRLFIEGVVASLMVLAGREGVAQDSVCISEFQAVNDATLEDEDGENSDWIELHNPGTNTVDLAGWYLTDRAAQLTQWRFPATNLPPNAYLVVFASGKNRRVPGAPLHTNFRLSGDGEYLALVRPDGTNVVSAYAPNFPPLVGGVSYGIPLQETVTTLIASGATARVVVPADDSLGSTWTGPLFDDSGWLSGPSGLGFDTRGRDPFVPVRLADSVAEFSGTQGQNNWHYGYWDQKADANGIYAAAEFQPFPGNYWTGTTWDWLGGDPPFTQLTANGGAPSGNAGSPALPLHWAIRRYVCETNGQVRITGTLTHASGWVYVWESGAASSSLLYLYHTGVGEGYLDDLKLVAGTVPEAGASLIQNGGFETVLTGPWTVSPNLSGSAITTAQRHSGNASLHIVSSAGGTSQGSSIYQTVSGLTTGAAYTLSYWYLPVANSAPLVVRFSGSWIDTTPVGALARILVDGEPVFQQRAPFSSSTYDVTVPANTGSHIDLALDAGSGGAGQVEVTFTAAVETTDPARTIVADSAADWSTAGAQGERNWFYGYYDRSADPDHTYHAGDFRAFPRDNGPPSASNFWDQEEWDWFSGNPPFDKIGQYWMMPNGTNSGAEHWVIRRWVSEVSGTVSLDWAGFKERPDQNNSGGGGVRVRILQNGLERDSAPIAGGDVFGVRRTLTLTDVQVGDTVDIALDPTNLDGRVHDDTDRTFVTAVIRGAPTLVSQVQSDLEGVMQGTNATAYARFAFTVADPAAFNSLVLRLKYDDGFLAYLNGVEVARANAPLLPDWQSQAAASRPETDAGDFQEFNLGASLGLLRSGDNVLAIHGLNASAADFDFLLLPDLRATSIRYDASATRYFSRPTPGAANGFGNTNLGPLIVSAAHTPALPADSDSLTVTARVAQTFYPVSSVRLIYRVMFSNEVNAPMFDDGLHGDGAADDGVWGASILAAASSPGQMVRYYVYATDLFGNAGRFPAYEDPKNSPQYEGTVVFNPGLTNPLPVLHLFVQNPTLATNYAGTRCSVFWDEEFFDNIEVNAHGQTTWRVFPKRSMDFNLNTGHKLRWKRGAERVKAFDLLSPYADKAYLRLVLAFETFRDAEVPTHYAFAVRVQQNNAFHSVMHWVEQANDDFLARNGLDPEGALYKIYFPLTNAYAGVKKETRQNEPNDDLQALIDGLSQTGPALRQFLFDHINVPEAVNFFATIEVVQNEDCCWYKNYYLHRESTGDGEWRILPWDLDLVFGRTFTAWPNPYQGQSGGYFDTNINWRNLYFNEQRASRGFIGSDQPIFDALWAIPEAQNMFLRRWSSVQEEFLQKTNAHPLLNRFDFEQRVDEMTAQLAPDAALDLALWGTWPPNPPVVQTQPQAASILKSQYFAQRRGWIFNTLAYANGGPYLGSQPTNATVRFGDIDFNPASGFQSQEYFQLRNTNNTPIDISGWTVGGAVEFTFRGGTVLPSNGVVYVSPDVKAFRARTTAPRGGQGLFVVGNYTGQLSARGETLQFTDRAGRLVSATNYTGQPTPAQQYLRVTEIMYRPEPPAGPGGEADDYEYLELKNTGPLPLNLVGVRFVAGIEFTFPADGAVTTLAPGASVVIVRNLAAFTARYGSGGNIAGQFTGTLDNAGENLRLEDAGGEKVLEFVYDNRWQPLTDGLGFALVIADEHASWDTWDLPSSWRTGHAPGGSPGQANPPPPSLPGIVVNELLSHSLSLLYDAVELSNPTTNDVDLEGWFLTDDFRSPNKFRFGPGSVIRAGDYFYLDERAFNAVPADPASFAFSSNGDEVYLFSGDAATNLTGYFHGFTFGATAADTTLGRHVTSLGEEHFVAQRAITFLAPNAGPRVGPVVISEVMYHPPDFPGGDDNQDDEFIELRNVTNSPVALFSPESPTNTWRLRGGVSFDFPPDTMLGAGQSLLLVSFDPADAAKLASFRARYVVPPAAPMLGPYAGKLDNSADRLELYEPGLTETNGETPYILAEAVGYQDELPWSPAADGAGASLQRREISAYGDDPANWTAAVPGAGGDYAGGTAPVITVQPTNQVVWGQVPLTFNVEAEGSAPLSYQWRINGTNLVGATQSALTLTHPLLVGEAVLSVVVFNAAGAAVSSNASLTLVVPAVITAHPQNRNVLLGSNATFTAAAVSVRPVAYQWRFNGQPIPGATSSSLTLSNAQPFFEGNYSVVVGDDFGAVASSNATLRVLEKPVITLQPLGMTAVQGGSATFTVAATGSAPISFRWRRAGATFTNGIILATPTNSTLTVTNLLPTNGVNFNVAVTNLAGPAPTSSNALLRVLADADRDGIPDELEPIEGAADGDGDGLSNAAEWFAGTDAADAASCLKLEILADGDVTLRFQAISNRTYTVQFSDQLDPALWQRLGNALAHSTNRVEVWTDPAPVNPRYYRVVTPIQR